MPINKYEWILHLLFEAKVNARRAAEALTENGATDEASMKTLAIMDAIDRAVEEIKLKRNCP